MFPRQYLFNNKNICKHFVICIGNTLLSYTSFTEISQFPEQVEMRFYNIAIARYSIYSILLEMNIKLILSKTHCCWY